jgi:hypothetical protein
MSCTLLKSCVPTLHSCSHAIVHLHPFPVSPPSRTELTASWLPWKHVVMHGLWVLTSVQPLCVDCIGMYAPAPQEVTLTALYSVHRFGCWRAALEVPHHCPSNTRSIIRECSTPRLVLMIGNVAKWVLLVLGPQRPMRSKTSPHLLLSAF